LAPRLTRRALIGRAALAWAAASAGCAGAARPRADTPEIVVERADDLIDTPWSIQLRGFTPTSRVEVTATLNGWGRAPWRSWAVFETDAAGQASLAMTPSLGGSYRGISPMGLFWSMERQAEESTVPTVSVTGAFPLTLTAATRDGATAEITLERRIAAPGVTRRDLTDGPVIGTLFTPPSPGPHPAIVVLAGSGGGVLLTPAALLASRGYAAVALGYFRMPGLPQGLVNIPLEYFETAIAWLRDTVRPREDFVGVIGWSRGGELALLLGASLPEVSAVVAYVPSGVLFGPLGPSEPADRRPRAAWVHRGRALPHLAEDNRTMDWSVVDQRRSPIVEKPAYFTMLRDRDAVERAMIPVERTRGPVLLISGKDDDQWPAFELAQIAYRRLQGHRHPYPFAHLAYEGAGHLITFPYTPTSATSYVHPVNGLTYSLGGHPAMTAAANADSWPKVLAFLRAAQNQR
jgi:dienelactone hydrolase